MSGFTPGPWKWFETADGNAIVNPAIGGPWIAELSVRNPFDPEQRANARLIAAAPEMYDALEEAARVLSDLPSTNQAGTRTRAAWERIRAVLAKVDG